MRKEYVMGNGAIALGALAAGLNLVAGYPGTPSSEILETVAKYPHDGVHVEWSVNEKAAMEVAASASYSGARTLVTMKQVGLNVASDPLMSLAYVGIKGGMVIVSADDPGPISSQTEQDTRMFADFCRIPVFDPSTPEEAYQMIQDAFDYSEKYKTPVLFRPTTRVCHAYASIEVKDEWKAKEYEGFVKDSKKWVIFPRLSFANHAMIEKRNVEIGDDFGSYSMNTVEGCGSKAVFASGISYCYAKETLKNVPDVKLVRIATPHPFPEQFVKNALDGVTEVMCLEELSPYIENQILRLAGKYHMDIDVRGKQTGDVPASGELSTNKAADILCDFLGLEKTSQVDVSDAPELPVRPPVLCAGCPHRASFYAVKKAMAGRKSYFCGDIGCYTLGNAMPLDMVDTCLCMGAGITMAQGFHWVDEDGVCFAFVGDSTFFASGMTGVVNAVYNDANMIDPQVQKIPPKEKFFSLAGTIISYFILLSLSLRLGLECFLFSSLVLLNYKLLHSLQLFLVQPYLLKLALRYLLRLFALEGDKLVKCSRIGKCLFYIIISKYNSYMASITFHHTAFTKLHMVYFFILKHYYILLSILFPSTILLKQTH